MKSGVLVLRKQTKLLDNFAPQGRQANIESGEVLYALPAPPGMWLPSPIPCKADSPYSCATGDTISVLAHGSYDSELPYICSAGYSGASNLPMQDDLRVKDQSGPSCAGLCPGGYFCPRGTALPHSCPNGTYCPTGSPAPHPLPERDVLERDQPHRGGGVRGLPERYELCHGLGHAHALPFGLLCAPRADGGVFGVSGREVPKRDGRNRLPHVHQRSVLSPGERPHQSRVTLARSASALASRPRPNASRARWGTGLATAPPSRACQASTNPTPERRVKRGASSAPPTRRLSRRRRRPRRIACARRATTTRWRMVRTSSVVRVLWAPTAATPSGAPSSTCRSGVVSGGHRRGRSTFGDAPTPAPAAHRIPAARTAPRAVGEVEKRAQLRARAHGRPCQLCETTADDSVYYVPAGEAVAHCASCEGQNTLFVITATVAAVLVCVLGYRLIVGIPQVNQSIWRALVLIERLRLMNKLKIVVGFMIIVTRIPETYGVTVPKIVQQILDAFKTVCNLSLDNFAPSLHCFGIESYLDLLQLLMLIPPILMAVSVVASFAYHAIRAGIERAGRTTAGSVQGGRRGGRLPSICGQGAHRCAPADALHPLPELSSHHEHCIRRLQMPRI